MTDLLHEFTTEVEDEDGHRYLACAMGRQRRGATVWEGWLEFSPRGRGGIVRKSPIETTQPNREALVYWASGPGRAAPRPRPHLRPSAPRSSLRPELPGSDARIRRRSRRGGASPRSAEPRARAHGPASCRTPCTIR